MSSPQLRGPRPAPAGPVAPAGQPRPDGPPGRLGLLGGFCARHPVWVIAAWLVLLAAVFAGRQALGPAYGDEVSLPGTQSHAGAELLADSAPGAGAPSGRVVFHVDSGTVAAHTGAVDGTLAGLKALPHVTAASPPVTSADGRTVYTTVSFDRQVKTLGHGYTERLDGAAAPARAAGVQVAYGGDLNQVVREPADDRTAELIGIAAALLILLLAFGSIAAALLPPATALLGVGVGLGAVGITAGIVTRILPRIRA